MDSLHEAFGWIAATLYVVMVIYLLRVRPTILSLQFTFSPGAFHSVVAAWSEAASSRIRNHYFLDFPFLVSYGLFGYFLVEETSLFAHLSHAMRNVAQWLLPFAAVVDAMENMLQISILRRPRSTILPHYYVFSGVFAVIKFGAILSFFSLLFIAWRSAAGIG